MTELIVNGVKEIVKNYAVDGIHFDDYFYPTTNEEIDEKEYSQYQSSGGDMGLSDWRRNNVCEMIKAVYKAVKEENSSVMFGISPQSKVSTDYSTLYADVENGRASRDMPITYARKFISDFIMKFSRSHAPQRNGANARRQLNYMSVCRFIKPVRRITLPRPIKAMQ